MLSLQPSLASQGVFNSNSNMVCDRTVSGAGQDKKVDETYSCIMLTLYDKACVLTVYVQLSTVIAENLIFNRLLSPQYLSIPPNSTALFGREFSLSY